jgi:hypothetical protein
VAMTIIREVTLILVLSNFNIIPLCLRHSQSTGPEVRMEEFLVHENLTRRY